jgi:hypothetical protein
MEINNLGLKFGVLNREVSSWQRWPIADGGAEHALKNTCVYNYIVNKMTYMYLFC